MTHCYCNSRKDIIDRIELLAELSIQVKCQCCESYLGLGFGGKVCDCVVGIGHSLQGRYNDMINLRL